MSAVIATLIGTLILAGVVYDVVRRITPHESRCPPLARLRGRRAALEDAEQWCVGLRMHGRIDASTYQHRMSGLARGHRRPAPHREASRRT
ncbi:hypothetical protein ACFWBV_08805 [Streptomyces sp. NPDC060030]|uniref:hypothetical protein n=1 Tax=Streptomyces sp. NPDC060030 TaxID=3347042 RepID=UPI003674AEFC